MPSQIKFDAVKGLKEKVDVAKSIVVADYAGLNASEQTELRAKVAEAGGEFFVAKNRLFKIAVSDSVSENQSELDTALNGQNAFLFALEDAVSALKALFEYAKDHENLKIKVGILDGKVLSYEETENLSKLPSKAELIAKLIGQIQAPTYGLVNVLSAPTRNLVYALQAIKDKKSE